MFHCDRVLPDVCHIRDALDVCVTLITGRERALLVDTGYGLEDLGAFIGSLTDLPYDVLLTHGHHDHALGSRFFPRVLALAGEEDVFRTYTTLARREKVLDNAAGRGAPVDREAFLRAPMPPVVPVCPGHTPGSAVVYVPQRKLLLTGDDWNPVTWLFFPEALPFKAYRENVRGLLALPFEHVLCSHRPGLFPREIFESFVTGLTDGAARSARPCDTGRAMGIDTAEMALPHGQVLVFDRQKAAL